VFSTNGLLHHTFADMSRKLAEIAEEALKLPHNEQLRLARTLLERSEAAGDVDAAAAWEEEIERRIALINSGLATGRSFADVLRDVDRRLGNGANK
jgi:predicted GTPase